MKIELIADTNCVSFQTYNNMKNRLIDEFDLAEIKISSYETQYQRLRELKANLLPVWLIDEEVQRINPGNYELLRNEVSRRIKNNIHKNERTIGLGYHTDAK